MLRSRHLHNRLTDMNGEGRCRNGAQRGRDYSETSMRLADNLHGSQYPTLNRIDFAKSREFLACYSASVDVVGKRRVASFFQATIGNFRPPLKRQLGGIESLRAIVEKHLGKSVTVGK